MGGRVRSLISRKGREYRSAVMGEALEHGAAALLSGRLSVEIDAHVPDRRVRDIDNLLKAILDACSHAGVWADDEQIDKLTITRRSRVAGGLVVMTVEEIA